MTDISKLINDFDSFQKSLIKAINEIPFEAFKQYNEETIKHIVESVSPNWYSTNYYEATPSNLIRQTQDLNGTYITPVKYIDRTDEFSRMKTIYLFNLGKLSTLKGTRQ